MGVKVPAGGPGHASPPAAFEAEPPRLTTCLNMTPVDYPDGTTGAPEFPAHELDLTDATSIEQILAHIDARIHAPLDDAWAGPPGTDGEDEWVDDPAEEAWAKALSEAMFGQRYGGPGQCYFGDSKWDSFIFSRMQKTSIDYMSQDVWGLRKKATAPATWLEVQIFKKQLEKRNTDLVAMMTDNDDPAISICCACEHNATYGTITRGFTLEQHMNGACWAAGQNPGRPIFDAQQFPGGRWYPTKEATLDVAAGLEKTPPIGPGTIYCYNPFGDNKMVTGYVPIAWVVTDAQGRPTVDQKHADHVLNDLPEKHSKHDAPKRMVTSSADQQSKIDTLLYSPSAPTSEAEAENMYVGVTLPATGQRKGSHIFFVLRVSKDEKRIQKFDTSNGYPLDKHAGDTVMDPLGKEGIYDGISLTTAPPGNVFCGMGVLPEAPVALDVMAAHIRRARPIGLMRLVIAERRPGRELSDRHVLFVSKLMRMYDDKDQNFWVSKCAWSLRNTPGFTSIQPWWIIYIPRMELARMMWTKGARSRKLSEMARDVSVIRRMKFDREQAKKTKKDPPPAPGLRYGEDYVAQIVLTNDDRGGALYWSRARSELSFGVTNEQIQGNPLPNAIKDSVTPVARQGRDPKLEVPWNGERFDDRYSDIDIAIPSLFRDGEDTRTAAEQDSMPIATDDEHANALRVCMIDDEPKEPGIVELV
ncbi:hypothetical protein [Sorangium sp. So ce128]|uniref:hypothetical protein n=1 Tax=Sorangium sp. So ce128 TaxID=3133281 RepID=UPI003F5F8C29